MKGLGVKGDKSHLPNFTGEQFKVFDITPCKKYASLSPGSVRI